jgi:hypothetical protein
LECSSNAKETAEQKLKRIICKHISDAEELSENYQDTAETALLCTRE